MAHAYDPATGRLIHQVVGSFPSGLAAEYQAQGLVIADGVDPVDRAAWRYQDGALVLATLSPEELLTQAQRAAYARLSADSRAYIAVYLGYDTAWQSTAHDMERTFDRVLADPAATQAQKDAAAQALARLEALRDFLMGALLAGYFRQKAAEVFASPDPAAVSWDFTQFDAQDPQVSLPLELIPLYETATATS